MKTKQSTLLFLGLTFFISQVFAQSIENTINLYGSNFPHEKVHVHFDKETYLPGETIWLKAYILEENLPSVRSTNFFVALFNDKGQIIQQKSAPVFNASAESFFDLPDSVGFSQVICRAYTNWMTNFDSSFYFYKAIPIAVPNTKPLAKKLLQSSIQFFPEGGDLIEGVQNSVAFKAAFSNGMPFNVSGVIKNNEGDSITAIKSVHDGMGRFNLETEPGKSYYAEWTDNEGKSKITALPVIKPEGLSLKLAQHNSNIVYNLINKLPSDSLHILMYMYQTVVYKKDIMVKQGSTYTAMVPASNLPAGTIVVTIFDKNWQPVAERLAFINKPENKTTVTVSKIAIDNHVRARNSLEILLTDTVPANLSISITDADFNHASSTQTILSSFLLSGNLKGYVHNPGYYFEKDSTGGHRINQLDLVMLTHGWRKYNWKEMLSKKMPVIKKMHDNYLMIYGKIDDFFLDKISAEEMVNLTVKTRDSSIYVYSVMPDKSGYFKQENLVFYDSALVYYGFNKNKNLNSKMNLGYANILSAHPRFLGNYAAYILADSSLAIAGSNKDLYEYYLRKNKLDAKVKMLERVTVISRKKTTNLLLQELNDRYTTGMFRGGATADVFDVLHDETASSYRDVYDYLSYKTFNVRVDGDFMRRRFYSTRTDGGVVIFLDEMRIEDNQAQNVNMQDIAFIKILPRYFGERSGENYPAAVLIYTKKGKDAISRSRLNSDLRVSEISGYSPYKEFYSPDYSLSNTETGTDARSTLLWKPYIMLNKENPKETIGFYNNDISKKFRVVLEGFNDDGKLIHQEYFFE